MDRLQMIEVTKAHWRQYHPESYKTLKAEGRLDREAAACADLTLMEMEVLQKTYGVSAMEAWQESRELFCIKDPLVQ